MLNLILTLVLNNGNINKGIENVAKKCGLFNNK